MSNLDPRIGKLNSGKFYAFAHGYDKEATIGTLEEVECALGLRTAPKKTAKPLKNYVVIMRQGFDITETEHSAETAAKAISKARDFWNMQDGRTRSCNLIPRTFRARVAN